MKFRLEFNPPPSKKKLSQRDGIMLVGSCFTENIGNKLEHAGFTILQNPSGILFNPISVCECLQNCIQNISISQEQLFHYNEAWHSWKHHSRFSHPDKSFVTENIKTANKASHLFLKTSQTLIITLGSAWVYELTDKALSYEAKTVAANNHKAPANWFEKRLLSNNEISDLLQKTVNRLLEFNPGLHMIFTISPVRHLREGFIENNRSKAALISAVHDIVLINESCSYFPAYELVLDDLRDYRFFAEDMVHPNYAATDYVWEKLKSVFFSEEAKTIAEEMQEIMTAMKHKPFNNKSTAHQLFLKSFLQKSDALHARFPFLSLQHITTYFETSLKN